MAPLLAVSAFTGKGWEAEVKPSWASSEMGGWAEWLCVEGYREEGSVKHPYYWVSFREQV